jgi:glutathione synthase/RimK-type ligase-like ATP-grasp enzyme
VILLCGIPSETPLARVREELERLNAPFVFFNQRRFAEMAMEFEIAGGQLNGWLQVAEHRYGLADFSAVYIRLMDDQRLPELAEEPWDSALRRRCRGVHDTLIRWCELTPALVVNRTAAMGSNSSKPYQAQIIREHGFAVPETLITNAPDLVRAFLERHQRVIYKSISGARSIVRILEADDGLRLERIRWCPTQFQAFVGGTDVRVHVIGDRVFATAIRTAAPDYRYAALQGSRADLEAIELPAELAVRCAGLAQALELPFAGIDLKITPEQQPYCFEVNPSPAFSYYEAASGQPIGEALASYLAGQSGEAARAWG